MSTQDEPSIFEKMQEAFIKGLLPIGVECLRLLPDSFVLGTAILAGLSMCTSYGVLLFTMVELMLGQRAFSMIIGAIMPVGAGPDVLQEVCQPGFNFPNNMRISILETIGTPSVFPSPTMFFLSGVISYMISAMQNFSREIKTLSGDIEVRTQVALVLSLLFMLLTLIFRSTYGCESFGTLLLSSVLGFIVGTFLVYQNIALFGRGGINILNIPIIQSSLEQGKPMYVCGSSDI